MGFEKKIITGVMPPKKVSTYQQTYLKSDGIDDVIILKTNTFPDDFGGWFKETVRLNDAGEISEVKLKVKQSNMSYLAAGAKRFWHVHPSQNELWTTNSTLLVGLIDLRKNSKTYLKKQKIILSIDKAVYIPHGVAHGFFNSNNYPVTLVYFADQQFTADNSTQEYRIDPKEMPYDFVEPELM